MKPTNPKSTRKKRRQLGSRKYRDYSEEMLELAVEMVEKKRMSSREAEKRFGIPRRTILNKINNRHTKPAGGQKKLSDEEETKLANVLIASADYGSPMTKMDLKMLVYKYVEKNSRTELFNGQLPSDVWVEGFLNRHRSKLSVRTTQNIKKNRAEKGLDEMEQFFDNLRETLNDVPPTNILNYDETNLADNPGTSKCVFRRGVKHPERVMNSSKSCISLMFTASAAGTCLPAYVVYKSANLYSEWVEGGPDGTRYNCSKSGWFDSACFEDYFRTIVLEWAKRTPGPKVVIGDNLSSHINIEVVELCEKHNIRLVFLPPNSTHITQPLDVAYFGPLKKEWKKILLDYKFKNPGQTTMNKKHFPKLLAQLLENIKHKECNNITSGFRATGIWPINPRNVFKRIPEYHDFEYGIDSTLLDYLKNTRCPNPMQIKRSKKLHTEPGKSVSTDDISTKSKPLKGKPQNTTRKKKFEGKVRTVKKYIKPDTETSTFILDSENDNDMTLAESSEIYHQLDEITGELFVQKFIPVTRKQNPNRLDEICIDFINMNMIFPAYSTNVQLSDTIVELDKMKNDCQNQSFIAIDNNDLPECLLPKTSLTKLTEVNEKTTASCSSSKPRLTITSNVKVTAKEVNSIRKKYNIKAERVVTQSALQMKILPKKMNKDDNSRKKNQETNTYNEEDVNVSQRKNAKKRKNTATEKKKISEKKRNSEKLKKKRVVKQKKLKSYSETSSETSFDILSIADTDHSEYATFDEYITTCLKDFGDKENFEPDINTIPFGLSEISYFTNDAILKVDDWVVVKFVTKKSLKHFVGRIINIKNSIPTVKFTRKVKNSKGEKVVFTYPDVEDMCTVNTNDIEIVLPPPNISRRGQIIFNTTSFDVSYNIQ